MTKEEEVYPNQRIYASSAESVGGFRFRQSSKCVIQGHFHCFEGAKSIGTSSYHTNLIVETLDGGAGKLSFGAKPVHQKSFMVLQHASNFLHGFQAAAQSAVAPGIQKARGPEG